jgi:hypothetical protein
MKKYLNVMTPLTTVNRILNSVTKTYILLLFAKVPSHFWKNKVNELNKILNISVLAQIVLLVSKAVK